MLPVFPNRVVPGKLMVDSATLSVTTAVKVTSSVLLVLLKFNSGLLLLRLIIVGGASSTLFITIIV